MIDPHFEEEIRDKLASIVENSHANLFHNLSEDQRHQAWICLAESNEAIAFFHAKYLAAGHDDPHLTRAVEDARLVLSTMLDRATRPEYIAESTFWNYYEEKIDNAIKRMPRPVEPEAPAPAAVEEKPVSLSEIVTTSMLEALPLRLDSRRHKQPESVTKHTEHVRRRAPAQRGPRFTLAQVDGFKADPTIQTLVGAISSLRMRHIGDIEGIAQDEQKLEAEKQKVADLLHLPVESPIIDMMITNANNKIDELVQRADTRLQH